MSDTITNYLTIDVEEYFQVSAFESIVSPDDWQNMEYRVELNTTKVLNLLAQYTVKATFFVVGWVAEKHPALVKKINAQGHEIGCHSYQHKKIYDLTPNEFRKDTLKAKDILEQITGKKITGYRAPSYSITPKSLWALYILEELGFTYDSSIFPIQINHDLYGLPGAPRFPYTIPGNSLVEYPISTALLLGQRIPIAGGGYFRLFPYWFTKMALQRINQRENQPFIFYLHPWELDSDQPRFNQASMLSRFRHYNNLHKTAGRFERLLQDFSFQPISLQKHD
jgi:polysaccharide deacetylase family protein (PEP-CTERM system associated)